MVRTVRSRERGRVRAGLAALTVLAALAGADTASAQSSLRGLRPDFSEFDRAPRFDRDPRFAPAPRFDRRPRVAPPRGPDLRVRRRAPPPKVAPPQPVQRLAQPAAPVRPAATPAPARPEPGASTTEFDPAAGPPPAVGIQIQPVSEDLARYFGLPDRRGALVTAVRPDSPASKAGIAVGDVIVAIGGVPVRKGTQFGNEVRSYRPGQVVNFQIISSRRRLAVPVTMELARGPAPAAPVVNDPPPGGSDVPAIGIEVAPQEDPRTPGLIIAKVAPNGSAALAPLHVGEVIVEVDYRPMVAVADLETVVAAARSRAAGLVLLRLRDRQGRFIMRAVRLAQ